MLLALCGIAVTAGATLGGLWMTGIVDLSQFWEQGPLRRADMVYVPTSARPIDAYSKVVRDDLFDREKGEYSYTPLPPEYVFLGLTLRIGRRGQLMCEPAEQSPALRAGVEVGDTLVGLDDQPAADIGAVRKLLSQRDLGDPISLVVEREGKQLKLETALEQYVFVTIGRITGRVLDRDKGAKYAFREIDFLPEDTRAGLAAGIPEGKRGLTFPADKLIGVHGLRIKDRVDLVANVPIAQLSIFDSHQSGAAGRRLPYAELAVAGGRGRGKPKSSEARVIAKDAVVVTPVTSRPAPGGRGGTVQQITIAVDDDDIPTVTEALALEVSIHCVAHSGLPQADSSDQPPPGMIDVPLSGRTIAANYRITYEDLIDPRTRKQRTLRLSTAGVAERGVIVDPAALLGRVLKQDKPAGGVFTESDLAPAGTPEGLAGALPSGRRSFTLRESRLEGAANLRRGDRIDILASLPVRLPEGAKWHQAPAEKAEVQVIVQDGLVLAPVDSAEARAADRGDEQQPGRQVILGVRADEVARLIQVLGSDGRLTAIFRSHRRDASGSDDAIDPALTPGIDPLERATQLETQVGRQQQTLIFPARGPFRATSPAVRPAESESSTGNQPRETSDRAAQSRARPRSSLARGLASKP